MTDVNSKKTVLYLAAPLFSAAERSFNRQLKDALSDYFEVFLPQEDGALMPELLAKGASVKEASNAVFGMDVRAVKRCDAMLVVLDGRSIDEGAAFELGLAFALGKYCVGLQTDFRRLAPFGNNPMIDGALSKVFTTPDELVAWARGHNFSGENARFQRNIEAAESVDS